MATASGSVTTRVDRGLRAANSSYASGSCVQSSEGHKRGEGLVHERSATMQQALLEDRLANIRIVNGPGR